MKKFILIMGCWFQPNNLPYKPSVHTRGSHTLVTFLVIPVHSPRIQTRYRQLVRRIKCVFLHSLCPSCPSQGHACTRGIDRVKHDTGIINRILHVCISTFKFLIIYVQKSNVYRLLVCALF
jgi:hypothetical protein